VRGCLYTFFGQTSSVRCRFDATVWASPPPPPGSSPACGNALGPALAEPPTLRLPAFHHHMLSSHYCHRHLVATTLVHCGANRLHPDRPPTMCIYPHRERTVRTQALMRKFCDGNINIVTQSVIQASRCVSRASGLSRHWFSGGRSRLHPSRQLAKTTSNVGNTGTTGFQYVVT